MLDPPTVAERIGAGGDAVYVDVRPVADFVRGHPRGQVVNVPIEFHHPTTGARHPNQAFLLVMNHALSSDRVVVCGGDADDRAERAARALLEAGWRHVAVMPLGLAGWRTCGLPVTGDNRPGVSYVSLLTPARRAAEGKHGGGHGHPEPASKA